jgi:hypothetical protein
VQLNCTQPLLWKVPIHPYLLYKFEDRTITTNDTLIKTLKIDLGYNASPVTRSDCGSPTQFEALHSHPIARHGERERSLLRDNVPHLSYAIRISMVYDGTLHVYLGGILGDK